MINSLTEGISMALNKEFGDDCTVFAEPVEQGLKEPCFFVFCISPVSRPFMGKRYLRRIRCVCSTSRMILTESMRNAVKLLTGSLTALNT